MTAKRKRSDPQATRYRIAVSALARAEKRQAAAERAGADLRRKVKAYERRIPPERRAAIEAGTAAARATAKERADLWKQATRTLRAAAAVAGSGDHSDVMVLKTPKGRRYRLCVMLPEGRCLVWDHRKGYLTGRFADRHGPCLDKPTSPPIEYLEAAE